MNRDRVRLLIGVQTTEQQYLMHNPKGIDKPFNVYTWRNRLTNQWNVLTLWLSIICAILLVTYLCVIASYPQVQRIIPWRGTLSYAVFESTLHAADVNRLTLHKRESLHASQCTKREFTVNTATRLDAHQYHVIVNLHDNEAIIPDVLNELIRLFAVICQSQDRLLCPNVFVSISDHDSQDLTRKHVIVFASYLADFGIAHRSTSHDTLSISSQLSHYNAEQRQPKRSDERVILISDVIFCAEDIIRLITHTFRSNDQACGLRFEMSRNSQLQLVNHASLQSLDKHNFRPQWPWMDGLTAGASSFATHIPVRCCASNSLIVMRARSVSQILSASNHDMMCIHNQNNTALVDMKVSVSSDWQVYEMLDYQPWMTREKKPGWR